MSRAQLLVRRCRIVRTRRLGAAFLAVAALLLTMRLAAGQESLSEPAAALGFRPLLNDADISNAQLESFAAWNGQINEVEAATISQILFRLDQFGQAMLPRESSGAEIGELENVTGIVRSVRRLELPATAPTDLQQSGLFECDVVSPDGSRVAILSDKVPAAWLKPSNLSALSEPASAVGVRLGTKQHEGGDVPLALTNHLSWHPTTGVAAGSAWLAQQGFDVALFDGIRQNRPFARPGETTEAAAFYGALARLAAGDAAEIRRLARDAVAAEATRRDAMARSASERERDLLKDLESALPGRQAIIEKELAALRQNRALAGHVKKRAALGVSSVAPLFNEPAESVGKFFVIEGIARRAVRIVVDEDGSARSTEGASPLTHYYELDVFPTDSQNNPVICCVARLPEGFPTGDLIREPVRVAGIFFKKWAYARRLDVGEPSSEASPRIAPPLMLAAEPEWLPAMAPARSDRGLWAGIAILAAAVAVALVLFRTARRDRLARRQSARYDGPPDDLLEPN